MYCRPFVVKPIPDPGLTDDFHLVAGSPAIDKASSTAYDLDLLPQPVPCGNAPDIGAFEYCE